MEPTKQVKKHMFVKKLSMQPSKPEQHMTILEEKAEVEKIPFIKKEAWAAEIKESENDDLASSLAQAFKIKKQGLEAKLTTRTESRQ